MTNKTTTALTTSMPAEGNEQPPKHGFFLNLLGSAGVVGSFFLPLFVYNDRTFFPLDSLKAIFAHLAQATVLKDIYLQSAISSFYLFGLTSLFVSFFVMLSSKPLPKWLIIPHVFFNLASMLISGAALFLALLNPRNDLTAFLMAPALLIWLGLFVQYFITWVRRDKIFRWKMVRMNWIVASVGLLFFSIGLIAISYEPKRHIDYGLVLASFSFILLIIGNLRNERPKFYDGL